MDYLPLYTDSIAGDIRSGIYQAYKDLALDVELPSLRDRFAMAALQGMLADPESSGNCEEFASVAYEYADAMLKEREPIT